MVETLNSRTFYLGIGAQKSGTSWLSNYFKSHPEILMSPIKEMAFFGNRERPNLNRFKEQLAFEDVLTAFTGRHNKKRRKHLNSRLDVQGDIENYKQFFQHLLKNEKAYGEITPGYAFLHKTEFHQILDHFPAVRIIFLMRNPVDRAWSQMRFSNTKNTPDKLRQNAVERLSKSAYTLRSDYKSTIETITSVFPRDQIHFEFFEHLFSQKAVDGICDFLGVSHKKARLGRKLNTALKAPLPQDLRLEMIEMLIPQYLFADSFFKGDIPESWLADLYSV
ncbi:MAG: sulfotransferase [Rhodobacterales bacterium]